MRYTGELTGDDIDEYMKNVNIIMNYNKKEKNKLSLFTNFTFYHSCTYAITFLTYYCMNQ